MQTAEVWLFVKRSGKLDHRNVGQRKERERERNTGRVKWKFFLWSRNERRKNFYSMDEDVLEDGKIGKRKWIIVSFLREDIFLFLWKFF